MSPDVAAMAHRLWDAAPVLGPVTGVEAIWSDARVPYLDAVEAMERRVADIAKGAASEAIWFLEHPSLYTAGTSAKPLDLLDSHRFPVFQSGRGGQYTYHGPGQLVAYVMLDLNARGRDIRRFVHTLEAWVIEALASYGIRGSRRDGYPGVWVGNPLGEGESSKIAAIGVRVRRWVTFHGVAINVCPNLSHFDGIVPCGIAGAGVTSLSALASSGGTTPQRRPDGSERFVPRGEG